MTDVRPSIYVYGIVAASDRTELESAGVGREQPRVRRIAEAGIAALVSDFSNGALAAARDLRAHWGVLEEAAARTTVLPVRFGTVMESEAAVVGELLAPNAERLAGVLAELDGKVQLSIKGFYDEEALLREVVRERPEIARMRERVQGLPEAASYYDRIRLGELVAAEIDRRRASDVELVLRRLEPLAVAARAEAPTTNNAALNTAFLVQRTRVDAFSGAVQQLAGELDGRVRIRYVGPLPPYNFADDDVTLASSAWA